MFRKTDDLRIQEVRPLIPPAILLEEIPLSERASNVVADARTSIAAILAGRTRACSSSPGPARSTTPRRRSTTRAGCARWPTRSPTPSSS